VRHARLVTPATPEVGLAQSWLVAEDRGMTLIELLREVPADAVTRFIDTWHGPADGALPDLPPGSLPDAVRRVASLAEARPSVVVQNHLVDDPDWGRDGNRRVFYVENQGVYVWATDGGGSDPVVWGRLNEPSERWQAEREPLSRFLLQMIVFEAIMGAPYAAAASWITLPQLEATVGPLERLPWGSWRWPAEPSWFYAGADVLAFANPNGRWPWGPSDHFDVVIGAGTLDGLAYLRDVQGVRWDREPG
jgi:hypothetical protein